MHPTSSLRVPASRAGARSFIETYTAPKEEIFMPQERKVSLQRKPALRILGGFLAVLYGCGKMSSLAQNSKQPPAPSKITGARALIPPNYVFSADVPHDAPLFAAGAASSQPFVDDFAWSGFVALNWPAPPSLQERGIPDRANIIGGYFKSTEGVGRTQPNGPVVWETYKDTDDIYLEHGTKPTDFDVAETIPVPCQLLAAANPTAARRTLFRTSKLTDAVQANVQADGNRLVDQNGKDVLYEVKVNRAYFDYVVSNGFYNKDNQTGQTISFPASANNTSQAAAIRVKAAWKVMGSSSSVQPDDPTRFYTTEALVLDPTNTTCSKKTLGLVGLHISIKTVGLPQWTWATFEHVDNAPTAEKISTQQKYNFYNPKSNAAINTPPPVGSKVPTQVMRVTPVDENAAGANEQFHKALTGLRSDNVWQYYMLVDAQWAGRPTPAGEPSQPQILSNTTLETYLQGKTTDPAAPRGCLNCHGKYAAATDFDFQIQSAQSSRLNDRHPARPATVRKP